MAIFNGEPLKRIDAISFSYEKIYSILSSLPENISIKYGRKLLEHFPIEKLFDFDLVHTKTNLAGIELEKPVILSSCFYEPKILERCMHLGFGAVVTKTITVDERKGHPEPNVCKRGKGFVNCEGHKNPGMNKYVSQLKKMKKHKPVFVSIGGEKIEDYEKLAKEFSINSDAIEISIGCPTTEYGCKFSENEMEVYQLVKSVREVTSKPLILKLSPDYKNKNKEIVKYAIDAGIDVINYGNTKRVYEPRLSIGYGGLSGPELFKDMIEGVGELRKTFGDEIQIIACGGITTGEDAKKAIDSGADAVSILTSFIKDITTPYKINEYLSRNW